MRDDRVPLGGSRVRRLNVKNELSARLRSDLIFSAPVWVFAYFFPFSRINHQGKKVWKKKIIKKQWHKRKNLDPSQAQDDVCIILTKKHRTNAMFLNILTRNLFSNNFYWNICFDRFVDKLNGIFTKLFDFIFQNDVLCC